MNDITTSSMFDHFSKIMAHIKCKGNNSDGTRSYTNVLYLYDATTNIMDKVTLFSRISSTQPSHMVSPSFCFLESDNRAVIEASSSNPHHLTSISITTMISSSSSDTHHHHHHRHSVHNLDIAWHECIPSAFPFLPAFSSQNPHEHSS